MKGIIYNGFNGLIHILNWINLIEWLKRLTKDKTNINLVVDVFIVLKFLFVLAVFYFDCASLLVEIIVWYLLIMNTHTYFYYHLWDESQDYGVRSVKRSFLLLMISVIFSNLCFSYLYYFSFHNCFSRVSGENMTKLDAMFFSSYNSLFSSYEQIEIVCSSGSSLTLFQLVISFVLLTVIVAESIPTSNSGRAD